MAESTTNMPPDYGLLLNIAIWALATGSATFLGLRVWGKFRRSRKLWWDDHILIASWISLVMSCVLQTVDTTLGFGRHNRDIDESKLDTTRLVSQIAGFFLIVAAAWSKTSFAVTLLRLSDGWMTKFIWFVIWTTNLAIAVSGIFQWAQCWPLDKLWRQNIPGTCFPLRTINGYNMFVAAYSGAMDVALSLLPWGIFWPLLAMKRREKLGIIFAMGMGIFAGVTSFMKIFAIHQVTRPNAPPEHVIILMILGTAESAITIMAVSVPVLRTVLKDASRLKPASSV